jgi:hypothetical protein
MGIKSSNPPDKGERSYRKRKLSAGGIRKQAPQKVGKTSAPKKDTAPRAQLNFTPQRSRPGRFTFREISIPGNRVPALCKGIRAANGKAWFPWPPGATNLNFSRTEPGSRADAATSAWRARISPSLWPPSPSLTPSGPKIWLSRCGRDFICSPDHGNLFSKQAFNCP